MKIGILTYHDGPNHGAYLQALATVLLLQSWGHEVEIINYKNTRHRYMEEVRPWLKYRRPARFVDHWKKHSAFRCDQKILPLSRYTNKAEEVRTMHYDVVVIGSDVVWNYKIFGYDDLYFGGVNAERVIAYAPSFGWVNEKDSHPVNLGEAFHRFAAISARDENTQTLVQLATGEQVPLVLDPTFLTDFTTVERPTKNPVFQKPYLLVYAYSMSDTAATEIQEFARSHDLRTIATGYRQDWCDHNRMEVGPLEWLSLVRNAHTVATSTFHGVVFSLKYQTPFFFYSNTKAKHRVSSIANLCGFAESLPARDEQLASRLIPADFDSAAKLECAAEQSRIWLKSNLSEGLQ